MKHLFQRFSIVLTVLLLFAACKKELSIEIPGAGGIAQGTLTDTSGNCKDIIIKGNYFVDTTLTDSNYVLMNVNFTLQGKYKILTDTVNGMWFIDSGFALTTGPAVVKVRGYGKPILPTASDFVVTFNSSYCGFSITPGTGGGTGSNNDYFPTTIGSNWTYQYNPKVQTMDMFTSTVTSDRFVFNNNTYFIFQTNTGASAQGDAFYFSKDGQGNYLTLSTTDFDYVAIFEETPGYYIPYIFLKDKANVNDTWQTPEYDSVKYQGNYGTSRADFTIVEKNVSHTVGTVTYTDVINVKREIKFKPFTGGNYTLVLSGNSYYAKNFGLIDQIIQTGTPQPQYISLKQVTIK